MTGLIENREKLLGLIVEKSCKNKEEIEGLAKEKQAKFSGLITEEGALFMLAKEFGVEMALEQAASEFCRVAKMENGLQGIDVKAKVKTVYPLKEFERNGKKGLRCSLVISDETGEITLTLWNKDAKKLEEIGVENNAVLLLKNCFVSEYNGAKQLNLSYNGSFDVLEQGNDNQNEKKISEISREDRGIGLVARVQQVFGIKKFEKENNSGELCSIVLNDGTGTIRAVAWNEQAKKASELETGDAVKINNAYAKQGIKGIELHIGSSSRIIKAKENFALPELNELLKRGAESKSIATLQESEQLQTVNAEIIELNRSLYYLVCPKCGKKPEKINEKNVCAECGEIKKPELRMVLSATIGDQSGIINAVFYNEQAEKLSGLTAIKLEEELETKNREEIIEEQRQKLLGKKLVVFGNVKKSKMNEELEFSVRLLEATEN